MQKEKRVALTTNSTTTAWLNGGGGASKGALWLLWFEGNKGMGKSLPSCARDRGDEMGFAST